MTVTKKAKKTVKVEEKQTVEDKILGNPTVAEKKIIKSYEDKSITYKITNLQVTNKPVTVSGDLVETFIGCKNLEARNELRSGAKKVFTKDFNGNNMYKIEVVE